MFEGKDLNKITVLMAVLAILGGVVGGVSLEYAMTKYNQAMTQE